MFNRLKPSGKYVCHLLLHQTAAPFPRTVFRLVLTIRSGHVLKTALTGWSS